VQRLDLQVRRCVTKADVVPYPETGNRCNRRFLSIAQGMLVKNCANSESTKSAGARSNLSAAM
jgi:hypothetical protein